MAIVVKPPDTIEEDASQSVFLAGTIDNGISEDWQSTVETSLDDLNVVIFNPRRDEWDSTWEQSITNPMFREQVEWELDGLERVDHIFMYFSPNSKSPITLLELGLMASSRKVIIVCPQGFWRRGNIEIVAYRYAIPVFENMHNELTELRKRLTYRK